MVGIEVTSKPQISLQTGSVCQGPFLLELSKNHWLAFWTYPSPHLNTQNQIRIVSEDLVLSDGYSLGKGDLFYKDTFFSNFNTIVML